MEVCSSCCKYIVAKISERMFYPWKIAKNGTKSVETWLLRNLVTTIDK